MCIQILRVFTKTKDSIKPSLFTLPTAEILSGKNARAGVSMVLYFFKYKTIETQARAFLSLNISAVGSVYCTLCTALVKESFVSLGSFSIRDKICQYVLRVL